MTMTNPVTSGCPPQILTAICKSLHHDSLSTFTTDSSGKLYVLRHDGHTLGVNSAQVGVFKQTHQVGLTCFLRTSTKNLFNTACLPQHPMRHKQEPVLHSKIQFHRRHVDHTTKNALCSGEHVSQLALFIHTP